MPSGRELAAGELAGGSARLCSLLLLLLLLALDGDDTVAVEKTQARWMLDRFSSVMMLLTLGYRHPLPLPLPQTRTRTMKLTMSSWESEVPEVKRVLLSSTQ